VQTPEVIFKIRPMGQMLYFRNQPYKVYLAASRQSAEFPVFINEFTAKA
jgi:hypothetical protein